MGNVFVEMTVTLDGYAAGPNVAVGHPFGDMGDVAIHDWLDSDHPVDKEAAAGTHRDTGAFILGKTMFNVGIDLWGPDGAFFVPSYVLTHEKREPLVRGKTTFYFVNDGPHAALSLARATAGDSDICIIGGPVVVQQFWNAGLVDELRIHTVPALLGSGSRLLDTLRHTPAVLTQIAASTSPHATHVTYRVG